MNWCIFNTADVIEVLKLFSPVQEGAIGKQHEPGYYTELILSPCFR